MDSMTAAVGLVFALCMVALFWHMLQKELQRDRELAAEKQAQQADQQERGVMEPQRNILFECGVTNNSRKLYLQVVPYINTLSQGATALFNSQLVAYIFAPGANGIAVLVPTTDASQATAFNIDPLTSTVTVGEMTVVALDGILTQSSFPLNYPRQGTPPSPKNPALGLIPTAWVAKSNESTPLFVGDCPLVRFREGAFQRSIPAPATLSPGSTTDESSTMWMRVESTDTPGLFNSSFVSSRQMSTSFQTKPMYIPSTQQLSANAFESPTVQTGVPVILTPWGSNLTVYSGYPPSKISNTGEIQPLLPVTQDTTFYIHKDRTIQPVSSDERDLGTDTSMSQSQTTRARLLLYTNTVTGGFQVARESSPPSGESPVLYFAVSLDGSLGALVPMASLYQASLQGYVADNGNTQMVLSSWPAPFVSKISWTGKTRTWINYFANLVLLRTASTEAGSQNPTPVPVGSASKFIPPALQVPSPAAVSSANSCSIQ